MAQVRAYKIAEQLGLDRIEFVEKARAAGVELKSAMASLDDEQVAFLREKLGVKARGPVIEARVERQGGATVIRRRKRVAEPEPELPEVASPEEALPEVAAPPASGEVEPAVEETAVAPPEAESVPVPAATTPSSAREQRPAGEAPRSRAAPATPDAPERAGQKRKQFKEVVNLKEQEQIARQVTSRITGRPSALSPRSFVSPRRKRRDVAPAKAPAAAEPKGVRRQVRVAGEISVAELAKQLGAKAAEVQGKLMALGTMVSINQTVDVETATRVAGEYEFEVQDVGFQESQYFETTDEAASKENLTPRPAVVTVMGHVDHGKTSLLDALREANVVASEAGGITQHIGAYQVQVGSHTVTFIDTPGHEAFTSMRARGAQVTDLVILVVAATEGIMPQTVEAIDHAKAAGVPIVVAINKCDLPDANSQLTRQRLMEHGIILEDFGGEVLAVDVSAVKRTGLDKLLEAVTLQAELLEPKADFSLRARGVVLESELDKGRGAVATVLVQEGTLRRGDIVVVGTHLGRVRSMLDERGEVTPEAPPSSPVQVIGLSGVPDAGDVLYAVENERAAKEIVSHRAAKSRGLEDSATRPRVSLEDLFARVEGGGPKELNLIIKADTHGSAGALRDSLEKLATEKVQLKVLHTSVGGVTENDVQLAKASGAIIVGFHVRPDTKARRAAEQGGVDIRSYQIIYEVIDEVRQAMAGLLPPTLKEVVLGQAEVRQLFTAPRIGAIAGSYVTDGKMRRNASCRLVRDGVQVYEGRFGSLRRFKEDVREVQTGFECGIGIEGFNDIKVGDVIEAFEFEELPAVL